MLCSEQLEQAYPESSVWAGSWNHTDHLPRVSGFPVAKVTGDLQFCSKILMHSQRRLRTESFIKLTASSYSLKQTVKLKELTQWLDRKEPPEF